MKLTKKLSLLALVLALALAAASAFQGAPQKAGTLTDRLGYPVGTKLLIIHADDLGVAHSVNQATFQALDKGSVSSASIMVPCPWFPEVAAWAKEHQDKDLGIHLTLTSEWQAYEWGPVAPVDQVKSLVDATGFLWDGAQEAASNIKPEEAEREARAQIERARKAGVNITHLDSHMGTFFTPQLFPIYVKLGREYQVPIFLPRDPRATAAMLQLLKDEMLVDAWGMASTAVSADNWAGFYEKYISALKPGVTVMIVHLGLDESELRGVMTEKAPFGSAWRQRDFDVMSSPRFRDALKQYNVQLVGWKDLAAKSKVTR